MGRPFTSMTAAALRLAATLMPLGLWVTGASACELCIQAANERLTLVDQLAFADRVVLASPDGESGQLKIVLTIKGGDQVGALLAEPFQPLQGKPLRDAFATAAETSRSEPLLLVSDGFHPSWTSLGTIGEENADWLRALAATVGYPDIDPGGLAQRMEPGLQHAQEAIWRERVLHALPHLGGGLHTVEEELAWSEIIRAPYGSLAVVAGQLPPDEVAEWLDDPAFASHIGGVLHLYGFVGGTEGGERVRERLMRAAEAHDAAALAPLLAAHLELEGPSRVDWIEAAYFADRSRSVAEIQAVLLALKLQGQANAAVPRARVIAALRRFIAERPPMAGSVALTLANWDYWGAKGDYEVILASGAIADPASEFAVTLYLQRAAAASQPSNR